MKNVRQIAALGFGLLLATPIVAQADPQLPEGVPPPAVSPPPAGDSFAELIQRAQQLTAVERHQEALAAWQAAYALRQRPGLWLEIARTQQRLGLAADAATSYRHFLTADPDPPPALRLEAEQAIARLDRLIAPARGAVNLNPESLPYKVLNRRYHSGMRTSGITLFAIGYAAAFISGVVMGSIYISSHNTDDKAVGAGSFCLLVPVLGPFLSGVVTPATAGYDGSIFALVWTLPWILTSGAMQVTGVGLWAGAYRHPQSTVVPNLPEISWRITPYANRDGAGMGLTVNF